MKEFTVIFRSVKEIADFVSIANRQPFRIQLLADDAVFDAKSLLSLFCLNLSTPMTVRIPECVDVASFYSEIAPYRADAQYA